MKARARKAAGFMVLMALLISLFVFYGCGKGVTAENYDVVIYGGSFAGCAAARTAALAAPDSSILVIVPGPSPVLGGIGTAGGQNFFDLRRWQGRLVAAGSFARWSRFGQFYNTGEMAALLRSELERHRNVSILWSHDIEGLQVEPGRSKKLEPNRPAPVRIVSVETREILRGRDGEVQWGEGRRLVKGKVFVDASEDGRLTRLAGVNVTTGRYDWPFGFVEAGERETKGLSRQQAATLMFKVTGVALPSAFCKIGDLVFSRDGRGGWGIAGGKNTFQTNPAVVAFNDLYGPRGYAVKPFNAAQDGAGSKEWWVNALLVFNVDGRACRRDENTLCYPPDKREDYLDVDRALTEAKKFLENPDFLRVLRQFSVTGEKGRRYGFHDVELVRDSAGKPVTGEALYLRETIHLVNDAPGRMLPKTGEASQRLPGYALTDGECQGAGKGPQDGADQDNYSTRIGLAYYAMDINAFSFHDLKQNGDYQWPVTGQLRPDWQAGGGEPRHPVYLPYGMLITSEAVNLLVPGYATGASSLAWAEVRVIPNLCVLGDAAGAAAARAVLYDEYPACFGKEQIMWVQEVLVRHGARLDK